MKCIKLWFGLLGMFCSLPASAEIVVNVRIENIAPADGVAITPLWIGFHSGNFDLYNGGVAAGRASAGIERIAEDGDVGQLTSDFANGLTYVNGSGMNGTFAATGSVAGRVQGAIASSMGPPPIQAGGSASMRFTIADGDANRFLSYATMVIPSNDYFIANANPSEIDLSSLFAGGLGSSFSFEIGLPGTVNDAGTELDNGSNALGGFNTSAANGLFGLPGGQTGPNQGADDPLAFIRTVDGNPFADFGTVVPDSLNFNNYTSGIGRITITVVPEPTSALLIGLAALPVCFRRRRA